MTDGTEAAADVVDVAAAVVAGEVAGEVPVPYVL